ncbi:MAG: adenylate/guanylate cyclase domain-containing protein [Flavobacteriaceae bacterium]
MQVCFYGKKRALRSLDLMAFFCPQGANEKFFIPDEMFSIEPTEALNKKMGATFNYHDAKRGWCFPINDAQKTIGVIFYPSDKPLSPQKKTVLLSLKQRLSDGIKINDLEFKLAQTHKDLSHKMLEVESLIDVTEIINEQQGQKSNLFDYLLITILSILNASKGMLLLKDEKSGFFNVISHFNIQKDDLPTRILRITRGVLKDLNQSKSSSIVDQPQAYNLLKSAQKNCMVSPLISEGNLEGAILLFDKESRNGLVRFIQQDLRLFDSLSKKVSLAYDNIRLIDSLKSSNKLVDNIMSSITTGIIMINVLGEIEFVNQSAKTIFGLNEEEVLNNHYYMVFQNNSNLIALLEHSETLDEAIFEDNFKVDDLGGESHEINLTLSPAFNEENERSGVVFSFEDLSSINKVKSTFKKYVSENIVEELLQNETSLELGGTQNDVCVLFCDIRGFTSLSEKMKPAEVVYLLNNYFEAMIDVVFANKGTLDKIIGDELMVLYGVPLKNEDDAQRAVNSGQQMFEALKRFNAKIKAEGLPSLQIGIGINFGKVVCGNIGSEKQMNYTVIGDVVNLAARLCSHAKPGEIVISESVYERLTHAQGFVAQKPIHVKGKEKEIQNWIYSVS